MIWDWIFYAALALFVYASIPKPQSQKPPSINDFQVPTADPSRKIPVIFGSPDIKAPNVVWYGDFEAKAIKKKTGKK